MKTPVFTWAFKMRPGWRNAKGPCERSGTPWLGIHLKFRFPSLGIRKKASPQVFIVNTPVMYGMLMPDVHVNQSGTQPLHNVCRPLSPETGQSATPASPRAYARYTRLVHMGMRGSSGQKLGGVPTWVIQQWYGLFSELFDMPAPPNCPLRHPKYHLIETIRP